jgi:integration host factor subunit alpha
MTDPPASPIAICNQAIAAHRWQTTARARCTPVAVSRWFSVDSASQRCFNLPAIEHFSKRMTIVALGNKAVNRAALYDAVYRKARLSRGESADLVDMVLREINSCLARGEQVKLSSFGTFTVRKKSQRMGRNPKTGVDVPIAPRRVVVFKASQIMKRQVNTKQPVRGVRLVTAEAQVD